MYLYSCDIDQFFTIKGIGNFNYTDTNVVNMIYRRAIVPKELLCLIQSNKISNIVSRCKILAIKQLRNNSSLRYLYVHSIEYSKENLDILRSITSLKSVAVTTETERDKFKDEIFNFPITIW